MTLRYRIILESPMGERRGTLLLRWDGSAISGTLSLLGFENPITGTLEGTTLHLSHRMRTLVSELDCITELHQSGGALCGTSKAGSVCMPLRGVAVSAESEKGWPDSYGADIRE